MFVLGKYLQEHWPTKIKLKTYLKIKNHINQCHEARVISCLDLHMMLQVLGG